MDTLIIKKLLRKFPCFKGVYPLDLIPSVKRTPTALIINTHPSYKPGEHWVCVLIDKYGFGEYFDSFGLPPLHLKIKDYLDKYCLKGWRFNPITIQSINSTTCGHYCVLYVMYRCQGKTYDDFMSLFNKNSIENDEKMNNLFGKYSF